MSTSRWVNVVAGAWLFLSAWLFPAPRWEDANQGLIGITIFLAAFVAMAYPRFRLVSLALGLWAVASPFALALSAGFASINLLASGLVVVAASLWPTHRQLGHGHALHR